MKTTRTYIEALATGLSQQSGITIEEGKKWSTDVKAKKVTYNTQDLLELDSGVAKGLILHEVGHIKHTTDNTQPSEIEKAIPAMQDVYNVFEDMRVDRKIINEFGSYGKQALEIENAYSSEVIAPTIAKKETLPLVKIMAGALTRNAYDEHYTNEGGTILSHAYTDIVRQLTDEQLKNLRELHVNNGAGSIIEKIKRAKDTKEVKELVDKHVYPLFKKEIEEYNKEQQKQESQDGKGKGKGSSKKGSLKSLKHLQEDEEHGHGQTKVKGLPQEFPNPEETRALLRPYISTVSRRLLDILKEHTAIRFEGNHISGRLLSRNAYKVVTGEERIFSRRNNPRKPDYTITIVLDESGSMTGARMRHTYMASVLLEEICKKLGFTIHVIIYDDDTRLEESVEAYRDFRGGGNEDDVAMREVLRVTSELENNIVFILTDGGVCSTPEHELKIMRDLKYIVIAIGIGLQGDDLEALRHYYKDTIEASNLEELPQIMINQLKRLIHR